MKSPAKVLFKFELKDKTRPVCTSGASLYAAHLLLLEIIGHGGESPRKRCPWRSAETQCGDCGAPLGKTHKQDNTWDLQLPFQCLSKTCWLRTLSRRHLRESQETFWSFFFFLFFMDNHPSIKGQSSCWLDHFSLLSDGALYWITGNEVFESLTPFVGLAFGSVQLVWQALGCHIHVGHGTSAVGMCTCTGCTAARTACLEGKITVLLAYESIQSRVWKTEPLCYFIRF